MLEVSSPSVRSAIARRRTGPSPAVAAAELAQRNIQRVVQGGTAAGERRVDGRFELRTIRGQRFDHLHLIGEADDRPPVAGRSVRRKLLAASWTTDILSDMLELVSSMTIRSTGTCDDSKKLTCCWTPSS